LAELRTKVLRGEGRVKKIHLAKLAVIVSKNIRQFNCRYSRAYYCCSDGIGAGKRMNKVRLFRWF
jgi:hypothetical protein